MGFNQFMLLDFAADYTVKHAGLIRRLDSISFMDSNSKWNVTALKLMFPFLNLYGPQVENLSTVCFFILHVSL